MNPKVIAVALDLAVCAVVIGIDCVLGEIEITI